MTDRAKTLGSHLGNRDFRMALVEPLTSMIRQGFTPEELRTVLHELVDETVEEAATRAKRRRRIKRG